MRSKATPIVERGRLVCAIATGLAASSCSWTVEELDPEPAIGQATAAVDGTMSSDVAAGSAHTCAITAGGVQCWGANGFGQLGDNSTAPSSFVRVAVSGLSTGVQSITAGSSHTCAVVNGGARCWGYNLHGQLGNTDLGGDESRVPVQVTGLASWVRVISAGNLHTCAIVNDAARCWGYNADGQLGGPAPVESAASVQVDGLTFGVTDITAGGSHSCAVAHGTARCWGLNDRGQLGNGTQDSSAAPVPVAGLPAGVQSIAAGLLHTCALVNGGVQCWGSNDLGQLGRPGPESNVPVTVTNLTSGVQEIVAGRNHTCALLTGGTVQCWGANGTGQLGTGTAFPSSPTPVAVVGLPSVVRVVVAGYQHSCATAGGSVWCWGNNGNGQLALDPDVSTQSPSPLLIGGLGIAVGCADGSVEQTFGGGMVGCAGAVPYPSRSSLCAAGFVTASALQWVTNRGAAVPGHNYWTSDPLRWGGDGTSACFVSLSAGNDCGTTPMRVCTPEGNDAEGNVCNWQRCGLYTNAPAHFFGGCVGNTNAGTICIPVSAPPSGCPRFASCQKWENGISRVPPSGATAEATGIRGNGVRHAFQLCNNFGCNEPTYSGSAEQPTAACQSAGSSRLGQIRTFIASSVALETSFNSPGAQTQRSSEAQATANVTPRYVIIESNHRSQPGPGGTFNTWDEQWGCVLDVVSAAPLNAPNDACGCAP